MTEVIEVVTASEIVDVLQPQLEIVEVVQKGDKGDKGEPGGTHYTHTQTSPSVTWTINHNLNKYPSIVLLTVGLVEFTADIVYSNKNQAIVTIAVATAGIAECN